MRVLPLARQSKPGEACFCRGDTRSRQQAAQAPYSGRFRWPHPKALRSTPALRFGDPGLLRLGFDGRERTPAGARGVSKVPRLETVRDQSLVQHPLVRELLRSVAPLFLSHNRRSPGLFVRLSQSPERATPRDHVIGHHVHEFLVLFVRLEGTEVLKIRT